MGGFGSGRRWGSKNVTDEYLSIDVRQWQRERYLAQGRAFDWVWRSNGRRLAFIHVSAEANRVVLAYRHQRSDGAWQPERYAVLLDWTPCHFGGHRAWFRCPVSGCGRRVAILYCSGLFACRHCLRLAYSSQRESAYERMVRRADRVKNSRSHDTAG